MPVMRAGSRNGSGRRRRAPASRERFCPRQVSGTAAENSEVFGAPVMGVAVAAKLVKGSSPVLNGTVTLKAPPDVTVSPIKYWPG